MNDATESSSHHGGKLEGGTHPLPFPSMLLLRKRPYEMDQQAKLAETEKLKKRGSSVLDRVKNFLPVMKTSEETLQREIETAQNPEQFDIENVEDGETAVEFNLGLFEYSSSDSEDLDAESDITEEPSISDISDDDHPVDEQVPDPSHQHTSAT